MVDENVLADADVLAEIRVEGRQHPERRVHRRARQSSEEIPYLLRRAIPGVDLRDDLLRFGDELGDLPVFRIVERDDLARALALENIVQAACPGWALIF